MNSLVFLLLLLIPQDAFTRFSYCRESTRGPSESQCIALTPQGAGEARLKARGEQEIRIPMQLTATGRDKFIALLTATNYIADGDKYESTKKVADLGMKRLVLEMTSGRREASFNFSTLREVTDLGVFFDALINQETILVDIDTALKFDRLSIPKRLEQIENELRANRIGDPQRLVPLLEKIEADSRLVNFARTRAARIKQQLTAPPK